MADVYRITGARGFIDRFYQLETAPALTTIAQRCAVSGDGLQEICEDLLMPTDVRDDRRAGALVLVFWRRFNLQWRQQVCSDDAVALQHNRAFRAGEFKTAVVTG